MEYDESLAEAYIYAVKRSMEKYAEEAVICDTIYFGGGTPSLLTAKQVSELIACVRKNFVIAPDTEITIEANPGSVDHEKLEALYNAGVNRISFGVQSACDSELSSLGRLHDYTQAENAVLMASQAGFDNISCDLMMGTPRQTMESLLDSARKIAALPISHISAYMLKIEKGTMFDCDWVRNKIPEEDTVCDMYENLIHVLKLEGFEQYEISNFAKRGFQSRHNLKYWQGESYLGFGPSAHSYYQGRRFYAPDDIYDYVSGDVQEDILEDEHPDKAEEYVMLSLRLTKGLSFIRYLELGGDPQKIYNKAQIFRGTGLLEISDEGIRLTPKGFLLSNSIIAELIC